MRKTHKKSSAFWKHGKHKGVAQIAIRENKEAEEKEKKKKTEMQNPKDFFAELKKKR